MHERIISVRAVGLVRQDETAKGLDPDKTGLKGGFEPPQEAAVGPIETSPLANNAIWVAQAILDTVWSKQTATAERHALACPVCVSA